jgi:polyisoprenoid-binding protein YceI
MTRSQRWFLRASALWAAYVWGVLAKNMLKDREHDVRFRVVHLMLAAVSFVFAGWTWRIASQAHEHITP